MSELYIEVGGILEHNGASYMAKEVKSRKVPACGGCAFFYSSCPPDVICSAGQRKDNRHIIFISTIVDKRGE